MVTIGLFLFGCYVALSGFEKGGVEGFGLLIVAVVLWIFSIASVAGSDDR